MSASVEKRSSAMGSLALPAVFSPAQEGFYATTPARAGRHPQSRPVISSIRRLSSRRRMRPIRRNARKLHPLLLQLRNRYNVASMTMLGR
jgi:hypothetical protein